MFLPYNPCPSLITLFSLLLFWINPQPAITNHQTPKEEQKETPHDKNAVSVGKSCDKDAGTTPPSEDAAQSNLPSTLNLRETFENVTERRQYASIADPEKQRERARHSNPRGFSRVHTRVSVHEAEAEFRELQRELTTISEKNKHPTKVPSRTSLDLEKSLGSESTNVDGEQFDLEAILRGDQREEQDAGMKTKQIGVIWDKLTV